MPTQEPSAPWLDRRQGANRRARTLRALILGNLEPRRRAPRRKDEKSFTAVDLHQPQWLAVALLILLLSIADALLTVTLMAHGAQEINPVMDAMLKGNGPHFAITKIGLTAGGIMLLALVARIRVFNRFPVGVVLYFLLAAYIALVGYELWLLDHITAHG